MEILSCLCRKHGRQARFRMAGNGITKQAILSVQLVITLQKKTKEDMKKQKEDCQT
jgi:hypothetical protein